MSGRHYIRSDKPRISEHFATNPVPEMAERVPDYNVAPPTL